ncbi:MAG: PQQ-binding-like beta-propeller repeat protein [Candidatus Moranbacteria bacterium]|nr:PQQ-binding-like beta-propeller repeat protein [Candidatus Moranbacteria bacterium]
MNSPTEKIRAYIVKEVFVRQGEQRFVPDTSEWIMDFRRVCLDPGFLDAYTEAFYERYKDRYPFQVGGMEVAAIPLVSAIIMKMRERGMPISGFFIRKSRKKTGLLKMIEGKLTDDPVILVDDLINNGYTLDRQLAVMTEAKKQTIAFCTVLRFRSLETYQRYFDQGVSIEAFFTLDDLPVALGTRPKQTEPLPKKKFEVKWYFKSPDALLEAVVPKSGVVFDEERLYVGSDCGVLWAINRIDGTAVWQHQIGLGPWGSKRDKQIFSTPVLYQGKLYFGAHDGNIYCVEALTGKRLWVSFEADWVEGAPALSEKKNILYVPTLFGMRGRQGGMVALDVMTGKALFRVRTQAALRGTPLVVDEQEQVYIGGEDGTLFAFDMNDGHTLWTFRSGGAIKDAPIYDSVSQAVIFSSFDGAVYKLDVKTGLLLWKYDIGLANYSAPCLWQDRVFVNSLDKNLYCLDLKTGEKLWSFPARARIFSSPRVYRDRVYFGANDARMYEIDPQTGRQTGFFQAVERITNPVVFDEKTGDFYLQTYANEIYCLREKETKAPEE